jgi:hypothetical protein
MLKGKGPISIRETQQVFDFFFFYNGATAPVGQGFLLIEDSRSHSDTPHSVVVLWTSDQHDAETST